jgi:KAP family P-loop domain
MSNYHNDQPITGSTKNPDRLHRETFASNLADIVILKPDEECITVSLEGEWGYGKTSVVHLVKKAAKSKILPPIIIEYNPWLAGKAEVLIQDFLVQFSAQLAIPNKPKERLKAVKELLAYSKLFNLMKFIPGIEPWASYVEGVFKVFKGTTKKISKLKELDMISRKNRIRQILTKLKQSILVIIDDIDRLTPDEAYQVVRLVKSVADFPNTSYLLCFDPEYLKVALEKHGIKKADKYIDKIIQVRVPLPIITYKDMQQLANNELMNLSDKSLTEHFDKDDDRLQLLYNQHIKYLIKTPRELKRIFNNLRFVHSQIEGEVCFTDLFCLSTISIKAQHIYKSLKESPEMFVGRSFDENYVMEKAAEVVKRYSDKVKELLEVCDNIERKHIHSLLKELFPLLEKDILSRSYGQNYDQIGRVASYKRLYIAMHYQVPSGFAADTDIRNFILGSINREKYINEAIKENFVDRFFELVHQNIEKIDNTQISDILKSLYDGFLHSDYLESLENGTMGFFGFEPFKNIVWITYALIKKAENKLELITKLVNESQYLPVTADILRRLMINNKEIETDNSQLLDEKWIEVTEYEEIKKKWSKVAIYEIKNGTLLDSVYASQIFHILYRLVENEVKELFTEWLAQENGFEKIAKLIGRNGTDTTNGPYAKIDKEMISKVIDYKELKKQVENELFSDKKLAANLKAVYLSISTGGKYYLNNAHKGSNY